MILFSLWTLFLGATALHFLRQPRLKVIPDGCGEPYLIRFYLFWFLGFNLKLHVIIRSDAERELHDHPWDYFSYMISGGYKEETPLKTPFADALQLLQAHNLDMQASQKKCFRFGDPTEKNYVPPGSLRFHKAPHPHRLELFQSGKQGATILYEPAITLVLSYPRKRVWGFYGKDKWIRHDVYESEDC